MKFKKELIKLANKLHSYGLKEESKKVRSIFKFSQVQLSDITLSNEWNNYISKTTTNPEAARMVAYAWNQKAINPVDDFDYRAFVKWYVDHKTKIGKKRGEHLHSHEIIKALVDTPEKMKILYNSLNLYVTNLVKTQNPNERGGQISSKVKKIMNRYKQGFSDLGEYVDKEEGIAQEELSKKRDDKAKEQKAIYERAKVRMSGKFFEFGSDGKQYEGIWILDPQTESARLTFKGYSEGSGPASQYDDILKKVLKRESERFMRALKANNPSSPYGTEVKDFINHKERLKNLDPAVITLHEAYQKALAK